MDTLKSSTVDKVLKEWKIGKDWDLERNQLFKWGNRFTNFKISLSPFSTILLFSRTLNQSEDRLRRPAARPRACRRRRATSSLAPPPLLFAIHRLCAFPICLWICGGVTTGLEAKRKVSRSGFVSASGGFTARFWSGLYGEWSDFRVCGLDRFYFRSFPGSLVVEVDDGWSLFRVSVFEIPTGFFDIRG